MVMNCLESMIENLKNGTILPGVDPVREATDNARLALDAIRLSLH